MEEFECLQDLTGQESGVVIYDTGAIVCNWAHYDGMPRLSMSGDMVIGLGEPTTMTPIPAKSKMNYFE